MTSQVVGALPGARGAGPPGPGESLTLPDDVVSAVPDRSPLVDPAEGAGLVAPRFLDGQRHSRWLSVAVRFGVPLALLGAWSWGSASGALAPEVLAPPASVLTALEELVATGQLGDFLAASGRRAGLGVLIGGGLGVFFGFVSGLSRLGEDLVDPTAQMLRAVPFLALVPLFISWFGVDESFKVALIAVSAAGPMYAYTYLGVRGVDRRTVEAARSFGLSGLRLSAGVILPEALPNLLMALRITLSVSLTGLIAAEQLGTTEGIGYLVTLAQQYFRPDYMVLCIVLYAALGVLIDLAVRVLERLAMPWRSTVVAR
jgi:sulfonate transport system permease protein